MSSMEGDSSSSLLQQQLERSPPAAVPSPGVSDTSAVCQAASLVFWGSSLGFV